MLNIKKMQQYCPLSDEPDLIPNLLSGNSHRVWDYNSKVQIGALFPIVCVVLASSTMTAPISHVPGPCSVLYVIHLA